MPDDKPVFTPFELQEKLNAQAEKHAADVAAMKDRQAQELAAAQDKIDELSQIANSVRLANGKVDYKKLLERPEDYMALRSSRAGRRLLNLKPNN
ncbi:MAG TPA: hypothetical protein VMJ32_12885 [Pirellulales bacterium]|nr:hypothetical protein [Pirellulales bacterium]